MVKILTVVDFNSSARTNLQSQQVVTKCTEAYLYMNTLKYYVTVGVVRYIMNIYKLFYTKNDEMNWRTADNIFYMAMIFKMRVVVMNAKKIYHILSDSSMCNIIIKNIFFSNEIKKI